MAERYEEGPSYVWAPYDPVLQCHVCEGYGVELYHDLPLECSACDGRGWFPMPKIKDLPKHPYYGRIKIGDD